MTYRDKLNAIAARLHEGPLSDQERVDLAKLLASHARQVGHIEECLDEQVEQARCDEIASFDYRCLPSGEMIQ